MLNTNSDMAQEPNLTLTTYNNEEEAFIKHNLSSNRTNPEVTAAPGQDANGMYTVGVSTL